MLITIPNLIKYLGFVLACFLVVWVFVTATTFLQLAAGILIYPVFVLFAYKLFAHKLQSHHPQRGPISITKPKIETEERAGHTHSSVGIADIDKRVFLKLIGGTGITLFLFSLFNKKAQDFFPGNIAGSAKIALEDTTGNLINPAQSQPLDGYRIAEIEDNIISFYGFTNKNGAWYVLRIDTIAGSFRYSRGDRDFSNNWANREALDYDYFDKVFGR